MPAEKELEAKGALAVMLIYAASLCLATCCCC